MSELYIGLMSGTSVDGIDAALVDFSRNYPRLVAHHDHDIPAAVSQMISQLCDASISQNELQLMAKIDREMGYLFAQAVNQLCKKAQVSPQQINAIGSHGQTIRHYPDGPQGFSIQIGDPNTIAVNTGIDVIADFRRKDIALGGQGAPLVPAFHQAIFGSNQQDRFIVNIGGIANLTYLKADEDDSVATVVGYDTGPGNTLLDKWVKEYLGKPYDENGQWARSGEVNNRLLDHMLNDPYFQQAPPKSTGREKFNLQWLEQFIDHEQYQACDIQATLTQLTAKSIAIQIKRFSQQAQVYLCGGGSFNRYLVESIAHYLPQCSVANTAKLGVDPQWVEAMAFAWLARAHKLKRAGNLPSVTGARAQAVLGTLTPA